MSKMECPYCHFEGEQGENMSVNENDEINLCRGNNGGYYFDIAADTKDLDISNPWTEFFSIDINYCPICGRKLNNEKRM